MTIEEELADVFDTKEPASPAQNNFYGGLEIAIAIIDHKIKEAQDADRD